MTSPYHEANRTYWDALSHWWARAADARDLWRRCPAEPHLVLTGQELTHLGDLRGKSICVLGSGDNQAVLALAGLGGELTSVDISQGQLDVAAVRAKELGLSICFVRADVTDLAPLGDARFDIVYTGGHVAVWVSDINRFYGQAAGILKPGGMLMVSEYHPLRRIWKDDLTRLEVHCSYFDRGPHIYEKPSPGGAMGQMRDGGGDVTPSPTMKQYEFHWTVSDYLRAIRQAGCDVIDVDEMGDKPEGWEFAPLTGLPQILLIVARKRAEAPA